MKTTINKKNPGRILGYLMAVAMVLFANVFAFSQTSAPYCETFDSGAPGWTNNGWVNDQYGTPSGNTGPTDDITGGGFYMYYETSTGYLPVVDITSDSIDISALAAPTLSFYNHMWGATIGVLNVFVNGALEWTMSGDQGNQWNYVQVDLSSYAGSNVSIKFEASYGGSFTGDIAIDQVCVDEYIVINGCTDPFALNYDASANTDDGSCTYCQGTYLSLNMFDSFGDGWNGAEMTLTGASSGTVFGPYTIASGSAAVEMMCMDDDCYAIDVTSGSWASEITWTITNDTGAVLASGGAPYYNQGALSVGVTCPVYGCMDPLALNFDSLATADDGNCAYICDPYVAYSSVVSVPSCNGAFDASVSAGVNNSFGNDFWLWDNGATTSTITGLAAGTYSCTITDSINLCTSVTTVTVNPTPVITLVGTTFDAVPGQANGGVTLAVSGGTPCYNGAAMTLAGTPNTTTQWASNAFDVVATSDLQITSVDQPTMAGVGSGNVWYRLGSGLGYEDDPNGWMLAGSATLTANFTGEQSNIPVSINMTAGDTICIYVEGVGINCVFGAGATPTYSAVVSSDANMSIVGGFATGGGPGSGTTLPSPGSYDFGGNLNYNLSSYTYLWNDSLATTTQNVAGLGLGPIGVTVTDCNGCTGTGSWFILTNYVYGCMDTLASNYDAAANTSWDQDSSGLTPPCLYDGCTDSSATNYDASANNDDGSCTYSCMHPNSGSWDDELTVTFAPDWYSDENSWYILNAITGDTALASPPYASGGAVDVHVLCAMDGCYYITGYDTFGDGWGGGTLDIVDYAGNTLVTFTVPTGTGASSPVFTVGAANCTLGCTDSIYANFNILATIDDGSCADSIYGCTDPNANNYTPFSNVDDGSCCYDNVISISCSGGSWQSEVSWLIMSSLGDTVLTGGAPYASVACLPDDCYTVDMYDAFGDGWNGNTITMTDASGNVIGSGGLTSGSAGSFTFSTGSAYCPVYGCNDTLASNYDPLVTDNDSSCCYDNYLAITTGIDYFGTPYSWSFNGMDWTVTLLGDTTPALIGSTIYGGTLTGDDADGCLPDGCYEFVANDASGWIGAYAWFSINGTMYTGPANGGSAGVPAYMTLALGSASCPIMGCTDPIAANYDSTATYDDGSCTYPCLTNEITWNMYDSFGDGWNGATYTLADAYTGAVVATGGLVTGAFELGTLCVPTGCYTLTVGGGTWDSEITFDFDTSLVGAGVGTYIVSVGGAACAPGCIDSLGCNYDPNAGIDDGSCDYTSCYGCTDPLALNYDSAMIFDDASCFYCQLTASTAIVNSTGNCDGSVDLTVNGTWCTSVTDLFVSVAGGNGQNGNAFNLINTSGAPLYIDGFSQGPGSGNISETGVAMEVFCAYADYTAGTPTWTSVATATVDLTTSLTTGYVQIPGGVTIPAGGTYGFWVGRSDGGTQQYTNGTGTIGVTPWASDANVTVTEGHGGIYDPNNPGLNYSPRNWNGTVHYGDPLAVNVTYAWSNGLISEDLANVCAGTYTVTATDCYGCTVTSSATVIVSIDYGCTDPLAFNYDPTANTDDGSCIPFINGCTDTAAANYDATANTDDGSCHYCFGSYSVTIEVTTNPWPTEVSWNLLDANGATILSGGAPFLLDTCLDGGCYSIDMFDSWGDGWNGSVFSITDNTSGASVSAGLATGSFGSANLSSAALGCNLNGCTDPTAFNYDPTATVDDGSCVYAGCTDSTAVNYDPIASVDDSSCCFDNIVTVSFYDSWGDGWNGAQMTVYNDGVFVTSGTLAGGSFYTDDLCLPTGCYDVTVGGGSFDSEITFDFGSLIGAAAGTYVVPVGLSSCVYGCTDPAAFNYDPAVTIDDGSCIAVVNGCTDPTQFNYDPLANVDDGSCVPYTYGCTNPNAFNYNPSVNTDDGSCVVLGCTDPAALNYDSTATIDDGTCTYLTCSVDVPSGVFASDIIHDRATINWDNMNSGACFVDQYRIKYRIVGTSSWSQKTLSAPVGSCTFPSNKTDKRIGNLTASSVYEYRMKAWYCGGGASAWTAMGTFTTADDCPNVGNLTVTSPTTTKATFTWDDSNGSYVFARLKARVDSISNPTGSDFFSIGGAGVQYPTFTKDKNGLVPGETYRGQARTWCDPNGGAYRSPSWTSLVYWTQPTVRIEGGESITNLDVYPNPSRDIFNITFISETVQNLRVRILNVMGEEIVIEDLQQFVGEYVKAIDLDQHAMGIYFLEIETNNGVINKKLILQ